MNHLEHLPPVKIGTWLYAESVPCEVRIVRHNVLYGTGDYEDEPNICEDQEVECFYVLIQSPVGQSGRWGGYFPALTLNAAILLTEAKCSGGITWE
ncbi:MAG: hypothetical protein LBF16_03885 [Pseudomonadales bacterium]|jgi:hypothetical protein|nr:hypothetical protein [Pseudomonadales bacterium]